MTNEISTNASLEVNSLGTEIDRDSLYGLSRVFGGLRSFHSTSIDTNVS
jgi:hypothetical protein